MHSIFLEISTKLLICEWNKLLDYYGQLSILVKVRDIEYTPKIILCLIIIDT